MSTAFADFVGTTHAIKTSEPLGCQLGAWTTELLGVSGLAMRASLQRG
jgi:hypothetical protein